MGWALAEAPFLCRREVGCSRSPQRGRTHHFQGLSRPLQERIQWVGPGAGHSTARSDGWGRSARTWVWPGICFLPEPLREGLQSYPGKNGEAEATAGNRLVLGHAANRPGCGGVPGGTRPASSYSPAPPSRAGEKWGAGERLTHPLGRAEGRGHVSPAPAPLAAAPGAGRGCQMLGRRRRRELRPARSCGARRRAGAPLARPLGPLRAARAGVRRGTGRPGGGSGTGMHSARLDSFLGQLRWELVRLGSGCVL